MVVANLHVVLRQYSIFAAFAYKTTAGSCSDPRFAFLKVTSWWMVVVFSNISIALKAAPTVQALPLFVLPLLRLCQYRVAAAHFAFRVQQVILYLQTARLRKCTFLVTAFGTQDQVPRLSVSVRDAELHSGLERM